MTDTPLTCEQLVEIVTEYLDGAMTDAERALFEAHLDDCDGCTEFVEQVRQTIAVAGALTVEDIPAGVRDRLLAAFADWRG